MTKRRTKHNKPREYTGFKDSKGHRLYVGDKVTYQYNQNASDWWIDPYDASDRAARGELVDTWAEGEDTIIRARSGRYELEKGRPSTMFGIDVQLEHRSHTFTKVQ